VLEALFILLEFLSPSRRIFIGSHSLPPLWFAVSVLQWGQVRAAWWHEQQDEVMDGFLVEPQNQGRAGTTWEPSHEWRLAEATPSSRGLQWFTRKPLGYSTRRCGHPGRFNRPGGAVRPLGAGQIYRAGLTAQGGGLTALAAGVARLASRLSRLRSPGIRLMKIFRRFPNLPLRGMYP
jgi:hypothetical protein